MKASQNRQDSGLTVDTDYWQPHIDLRRCTGCGDCITRCPTGALGWSGGKAALIRPDACTYDAICEAICPAGAIELPYLVCTLATARVLSLSTGATMNPYAYIASVYESLPDIPQDSILSRTLYADDDVKVVLFGFATGQELSEHTASMPATIIILRGDADLTLGGDKMSACAGTVVHMTANLPHSVYAKTPVVMLLLMIRSGKEGKSG